MATTTFHLLPVGRRFRFEGEDYIKTSPLLASSERSGKQRLVPRSATVEFAQEPHEPPSESAPRQLPLAEVTHAFEAYEAACRRALDEVFARLDPETVERAKAALNEARRDFLRRL